MTWKKALLRGLLGVPIGVTIGYGITVAMSLWFGDGSFSPVVPALTEATGSEAAATAVQFLLMCLMGFVFALASCLWEVERWSLLRQTVLHFLALSSTTLLVAGVCRWAEYTPGGLWGYLGFFLLLYAVPYVSISLHVRRRVRAANRRLEGAGRDNL